MNSRSSDSRHSLPKTSGWCWPLNLEQGWNLPGDGFESGAEHAWGIKSDKLVFSVDQKSKELESTSLKAQEISPEHPKKSLTAKNLVSNRKLRGNFNIHWQEVYYTNFEHIICWSPQEVSQLLCQSLITTNTERIFSLNKHITISLATMISALRTAHFWISTQFCAVAAGKKRTQTIPRIIFLDSNKEVGENRILTEHSQPRHHLTREQMPRNELYFTQLQFPFHVKSGMWISPNKAPIHMELFQLTPFRKQSPAVPSASPAPHCAQRILLRSHHG